MTQANSPSPKRHCMVVHAFYPLAETRVQRESEALVQCGYEVDVICLRGSKETAFEVHRGVNVHRLPVQLTKQTFAFQMLNYLNFFFRAMIRLTQLHRQRHYTSIQVHNLPDFLVFCTLFPKLQGVPVILDLHDLMPEFFAVRSGKSMSHWSVRLVALQERLACKFANRVITVTELWRQSLIGRGVPADKISVVMNVADSRIFHRPSAPNGNGHGGNGRFHILYHGSQTYRYGIDLILRAIDRVRDQIPDLLLTIHGKGDYTGALMALAKELNLDDRVEFSDRFVPLDDLLKLIRAADLAVVPYRRDIFTDGILPTKLMEYVAVGVPVLVARTPAIESYFDEAMVEYFNAENIDELAAGILKLYRDPQRRAALVKNSDTFNRRYEWSRLSAEYAGLVESLAARRN